MVARRAQLLHSGAWLPATGVNVEHPAARVFSVWASAPYKLHEQQRVLSPSKCPDTLKLRLLRIHVNLGESRS